MSMSRMRWMALGLVAAVACKDAEKSAYVAEPQSRGRGGDKNAAPAGYARPGVPATRTSTKTARSDPGTTGTGPRIHRHATPSSNAT